MKYSTLRRTPGKSQCTVPISKPGVELAIICSLDYIIICYHYQPVETPCVIAAADPRNGIGEVSPGDKSYDRPEGSPGYFSPENSCEGSLRESSSRASSSRSRDSLVFTSLYGIISEPLSAYYSCARLVYEILGRI